MAQLSSHALCTLARDARVSATCASPSPSSASSTPSTSSTAATHGEFVVVGYADGAVALFADLLAFAFDPRRAGDAPRARHARSYAPTWVSDPPRGSWDMDDDGAPRRGCDACVASVELNRVVRCCGTPPAIEVLDLSTGTVLRSLTLPTAWPCVGACAASACGTVGGEYCYVASATKWNHSGDEFLGNAATCAVWRISGDMKDTSPCAVFVVNAERARMSGGIGEAKTLAPFAGLTSADGVVEFVTVTVNFDEQKVRGEHMRYSFKDGDARGRAMQGISIDMGWLPKHRVARSRALDEDSRSMPSVPVCVITRQCIVTIWCDGEHPVRVIDRKAERSNDSRRYLLDALRRNVEKCVASPNTSAVRAVVDARAYDDDGYLALILRDTPVLQPGQTAHESDVDYKLVLVPTGFKSSSAERRKPMFTSAKPLIDISASTSCAICLEDTTDENAVSVSCCAATFCDACLTAYMSLSANKGCPMCRNVEAFWMNASTVLQPIDAADVASFEVHNASAIRSHLRSYRVLEQDVSLGDYAELDERHLRGERPPFTCTKSGRVCTIRANTVELRALTKSSSTRTVFATI